MDQIRPADTLRIQQAPGGGRVKAAMCPRVRAKALRLVLFNWVLLLPVVVCAAPLLRRLFPTDAELPRLYLAPLTGLLWFLLHDISFYCYHRTLHEVPWLYRRFHKPHHVLTAPFAWGSHAVHPVELALQSIGAMTGPLLWSVLYGLPLHAWWVWLSIVQLQGVLDHTGFALPHPFDLFALLPGFGGTKFHDEHHQYFHGNYAAAISWIDDFMGTRIEAGGRIKGKALAKEH